MNEITTLLNRPTVSPWLLSAFSVFLGILGGIVGRFVEPYLADFYRRAKLRRVLYVDIFDLYFIFETVSNPGETPVDFTPEERIVELTKQLTFDGEQYLKANRETYLELGERNVADGVYSILHRALEDKNYITEELDNIRYYLFQNIRNGRLRKRLLKRYLSKFQYRWLLDKVQSYEPQKFIVTSH